MEHTTEKKNDDHNNKSYEKKYDFDRITDRKGTSSLKYDFGPERKGRDDLLPLWVADMDFRLPGEILDEIQKRTAHGIFGYTDPKPDYKESVRTWFLEKHRWDVHPDWITITPGVVYAISTAIRAFTKKGDAVIIQQPVYYPFSECIKDNGRKVINSQLIYENGRYRMDYEDFEKKIQEHQVRLFLLCSPHNPVGRVWSREELETIGEICLRHHVLIFSDEIHCDITYPGAVHTPFASIHKELEDLVIVGTSPSKTFNLAGLQVSNIIIPNEKLRARFRRENAAAGYSQANVLGMTACKAAYDLGTPWYRELLAYLKGNLDFTEHFLKTRFPRIHMVQPEGTYLIWLDFSESGLTPARLETLITDKAHLWLDSGIIFGQETALFERINIACPRSILEQALLQLENALSDIGFSL
ncbi:MAG: MalY/PatB family protein [Lachnospiraceae bacterium]|nr:MalY/PatB family protein [Lachnospiraceae bacterium]